jgi:hypothetical protein
LPLKLSEIDKSNGKSGIGGRLKKFLKNNSTWRKNNDLILRDGVTP